MKKILSLSLAAAMIIGTAATVMADQANAGDGTLMFGSNNWYYVNGSEQVTTLVDNTANLKAGDKIATPILMIEMDEDATDPTLTATFATDEMRSDSVKSWKLRGDWDKNGDLVEAINIESLKFIADGNTSNTATTITSDAFSYMYDDTAEAVAAGAATYAEGNYYYWLTLEVDSEIVTGDDDIMGEITLYKTSSNNYADKTTINKSGTNFATSGFKDIAYDESGFEEIMPEGEGAPVRDFPSGYEDSDFYFTFEGIGEFQVNGQGQNDLYMAFNTDPIEEVLDEHYYTDLDFVNFPGTPEFYRTGIFYFYAEEDQYLYQVNDGMIEMVDYVWDEDVEAFKFALKNFPESFILAGEELSIEMVEEEATEEAPVVEEVKPIPDTGR